VQQRQGVGVETGTAHAYGYVVDIRHAGSPEVGVGLIWVRPRNIH
jgi:hypothetical protein